MTPHDIDFKPTPDGWQCRVWFTVLTARQQHAEEHYGVGFGRWFWLSWWRARADAWDRFEALQAIPGARESRGW